jgi:hypothetical protein
MDERLARIEAKYLGQDIEEFLVFGGDAREYARLVFAGQIFGPGEDPRDEGLGIGTEADLVEALEALARAAVLRVRTLDPHTRGVIFENGEEVDEVHFDFYSEDRAEWERLADERLQEAGFQRIGEWRDDSGGAAADIIRL